MSTAILGVDVGGTFTDFYLLRDGSRPGDRFGLQPIPPEAPQYWKFRE